VGGDSVFVGVKAFRQTTACKLPRPYAAEPERVAPEFPKSKREVSSTTVHGGTLGRRSVPAAFVLAPHQP